MSKHLWLSILALCSLAGMTSAVSAQPVPYIGYAYPAGGRQGTTFQVRLGGQRLDGVDQVWVSGEGVAAKVVEYRRQLGPQENSLLREQLRELRGDVRGDQPLLNKDDATLGLIARLENRIMDFVPRPASAALASVVLIEVSIAEDAAPGARELRLVTLRGITNPLVFHVGQVPEVARKPMDTCAFQVLGKESLAQRKRPKEEEEVQITLPCTMNGQIASGEVNRYRFEARKGQRLVISVAARQLIPYIADAVPGWFQPVITLCDAHGRELAFSDDYRFKPDPVIGWEVPEDGAYVLAITDAIYRGREDFVYRVTIGQLPFITSIFPLGQRAGEPVQITMQGWNLENAELLPPPDNAAPGTHLVAARSPDGYISNHLPFVIDTWPQSTDAEANDDPQHAQAVAMPVMVNGRIDRGGDWDVFRVEGRAGDTVVAEVHARQLESPLDAMLKLTDHAGKVVAVNDDHEDPAAGVNTHHADSYLMVPLPADGTYYLHVGDTARSGGPEYAYRLRISAPQPDFALRTVPSGVSLRGRAGGPVTVYAIRQDGFAGDIELHLKDAPLGLRSPGARLTATSEMVRLPIRTPMRRTEHPVPLVVAGRATIGDREVTHVAVPADDRMQAFLWRHLVPAQELVALVFDPAYQPPATRVPPPLTDEQKAAAEQPAEKRKFTERQVAGRLRQLRALYEEYLLTDDFYNRKVAECGN